MDEVCVKIPPGDSQDTFTGERYIPSVSGEIAWEHLHRYAAAVQLCGGKKVLDIASGEGYGSYMLSQVAASVVGVDIDEPTISRAVERYRRDNLQFKVGSCESIPCESSSFDVVVSFETIEHILDPGVFLAEVQRVLRPDGFLIVSSPERDAYNAGRVGHNEFHLNEMSEQELSEVLSRRFRYVSIACQSSVFGSVLLPSQRAERSPSVFQAVAGDLRSSHTIRKSPYILALCTNSEAPPSLSASIFDSGLPSSTLSALEGGIAERDAKIREFIEQHVDFQRHIGALQGGIEERDKKILELLHVYAQSQEREGAFRGGVEERDKALRELSERIVRFQEQVDALRGGIEERDATISELLSRCAEVALPTQVGEGAGISSAQLHWLVQSAESALEAREAEIAVARAKILKDGESKGADSSEVFTKLKRLTDEVSLLTRICDAIRSGRGGGLGTERAEPAQVGIESDVRRSDDGGGWSMAVSTISSSPAVSFSMRKAWKSLAEKLGSESRGDGSVVEPPAVQPTALLVKVLRESRLFDAKFYLAQLTEAEKEGVVDPLKHYIVEGDLRDIAPHPLFNPAYYRRYSMGACDQRQNTLGHYLSNQWRGRGVTSPIFDSKWYLDHNPDVAQSGINALCHYVNHGAFEGRWPAEWFNPAHYRSQNPKLLPQHNPAIDFMVKGHASYQSPQLPRPSALDVSTNPVIRSILTSGIFDADYYRTQLSSADLSAMLDPLWHYVTEGDAKGLAPHVLFDSSMYRRCYMTHSEGVENSLVHYLSGRWHGLGKTSFFFDSRWYLDTNPDVAGSGINPLVHFVTTGSREGRWPIVWFNAERYRKHFGLELSDDVVTHFVRGGCTSYEFPELPISYLDSLKMVAFARRGAVPLEKEELAQLVGGLHELTAQADGLRGPLDEAPRVSIIIPVYNQLRYTLNCIESILRVNPSASFEILVVDDCSSDQTAEALREIPSIRVHTQERNGGFIASCNRGASEARGEYLLFLNNDTHVLPGWLDELLGTLESNERAAIVGSQLIYPDGVLQEAGGIFWQDGSAWNYGRYGDPNRPEFSYVRNVDWCSGASIMISRSRFEELGEFDRVYSPAYCEDVELAFRARQKGYQVLYQPRSKVVHFEGVTSGTDTTKGVKAYQVTNLQRLGTKWRDKLSRHAASGTRIFQERNRGVRGHILFVDACFPTPDQDAGSTVADSWMKILVGLGYHVTFVAMHQFTRIPHYTDRLERLGIFCPVHPYERSPFEFIKSTGNFYDVIVAHRHSCAEVAYEALAAAGVSIPKIFLPADLHFVREARLAELEGSAAKRIASFLTQYKELQVFLNSDLTCVHSSFEREELLRHDPEARVEVTPIMFPVPGRSVPFEARRDICFVGGFRHTPNVDAMMFFVGEVWPLVVAKLPGVKLKIIGANAPAELQDLASESIEVTGFIQDIKPIFDSIKLSIAPVRYGAGVKGKVGLSMSHGVPVVGTPMACEGMDLVEGKEVLIGRTPEELAAYIIQVYTDRDLWYAVSDGGFARAHREYSLEGNVPLFERYLQQIGLECAADHTPADERSLVNG